jgi:predicted GNAT superfamily acetyltransferase
MRIRYKQADTREELLKILELQRRNLPENLSAPELEREGFLTVRHQLEILEAMNNVCGHIIALEGEYLAGYALCMHPVFSNRISVLQPMFKRLENLFPHLSNYMVMGQVCIDLTYRSRGIFRGLYGNMQDLLKPDYAMIITEVDTRNTRSMRAHKAIGFETLSTYSSGGRNWEILHLGTLTTVLKPG